MITKRIGRGSLRNPAPTNIKGGCRVSLGHTLPGMARASDTTWSCSEVKVWEKHFLLLQLTLLEELPLLAESGKPKCSASEMLCIMSSVMLLLMCKITRDSISTYLLKGNKILVFTSLCGLLHSPAAHYTLTRAQWLECTQASIVSSGSEAARPPTAKTCSAFKGKSRLTVRRPRVGKWGIRFLILLSKSRPELIFPISSIDHFKPIRVCSEDVLNREVNTGPYHTHRVVLTHPGNDRLVPTN